MTDFFTLLAEPRRPWLDGETLKTKFLALSTAVHPDHVHNASEAEKLAANEGFAQLNTAHTTLREPKDRLRHLLELELGALPTDSQQYPADLMNLFMDVGQLCRDTDHFLSERAKVTSPMLRVQWFERGLDWTDKINALQLTLAAKRDALTTELQAMNSAWDTAPEITSPERRNALPLARLEAIYRTFSYLTRWSAQLQERTVNISF